MSANLFCVTHSLVFCIIK